ncbi:MAG TPA: hypothetical protein VNJ54_07750 [Plantibacter sp.]|uniref:hypothetical protein n=1 Tax=unclassified Plantibacter TaxID=2624265 RepID=UPI002C59BEA2|nr:hypothetical protein [Plantibacter sp.]
MSGSGALASGAPSASTPTTWSAVRSSDTGSEPFAGTSASGTKTPNRPIARYPSVVMDDPDTETVGMWSPLRSAPRTLTLTMRPSADVTQLQDPESVTPPAPPPFERGNVPVSKAPTRQLCGTGALSGLTVASRAPAGYPPRSIWKVTSSATFPAPRVPRPASVLKPVTERYASCAMYQPGVPSCSVTPVTIGPRLTPTLTRGVLLTTTLGAVVFATISEPPDGSDATAVIPSRGEVITVPCGGAATSSAVRSTALTEFGRTLVRTHSTTERSSLTVDPAVQ